MEDTAHYLWYCHHLSYHCAILKLIVWNSFCDNFDTIPDNFKEDLLLYCDSLFDENKNKVILKATVNYIKNTERFSVFLFD